MYKLLQNITFIVVPDDYNIPLRVMGKHVRGFKVALFLLIPTFEIAADFKVISFKAKY